MKASSQAADWADTLSIWIHPSGALARNLGHREQDDAGESLTDLEHQALIDEDSQRLGPDLYGPDRAEDGPDRYKTSSQAGLKMHYLDSPGSGPP